MNAYAGVMGSCWPQIGVGLPFAVVPLRRIIHRVHGTCLSLLPRSGGVAKARLEGTDLIPVFRLLAENDMKVGFTFLPSNENDF